jgi:hypothetical protein
MLHVLILICASSLARDACDTGTARAYKATMEKAPCAASLSWRNWAVPRSDPRKTNICL